MDLINMTLKERKKWKRLRRDYFNEIVSKYSSLEDFFLAEEYNMAVRGYTVAMYKGFIGITVWLDYGEYEEYYVVPAKSDSLRVSNIIMWQDDCCANSYDYLAEEYIREDTKLIEGEEFNTENETYSDIYSWSRTSRLYPEKLIAIGDDCPDCIYYSGRHWLLRHKEIVAIVGSRDCDEAGRILAYKIAQKVAREGKAVFSGLALGIDTSAHLGCLDAGGETIAVVGSGIDIVHPKENAWLQERIKFNGGLIMSEQPPGTKVNPTRLIARCRLQAALADKVIVVQCSNPSGSLHTAEFARRYGKPVYAVKFDDTTPQNAGNEYLLENGLAQPLNEKM